MDRPGRQGGFMLIAAIVLIVVAAALAVTIALIAGTSTGSAADNLQSGQALFVANSGLEFEVRRMARNVDWYRSSTDPTAASGPQALGQGTFTSFSNFAATKLRRRVVGASTTICVYTIDRFPTSGTIQIDDDISVGAEFVTYTGTTASSAACGNLPAFTGIGRGATVGGLTPPQGNHFRDDIAYPVTTLIDNLAASATCVAPATLRITDNSKFLSTGTISLDDGALNSEDISYASSTRAGGVMTLSGLKRLLGTTCPAWTGGGGAAGAPVRPQLANSTGGSGNDYEALASSSGTVGNAQRAMIRVLQR
jgi:type II secretory pathway pseudopilin PulG